MLKKFRRRFILITMVLVGIVSFIAFAVVGFNNYSTMKGDVEHTLEMAVSDTGSTQSFPGFGRGKGGGDGWHGQGERMRNIPVLAVTIYLDNPGYIVTDASSTAVIEDSDTLQDVVTATLADGAESGKLADYGLYYRLSTSSTSYRIAFVSASQVEGELLQSLGVLAALWAVLMLAIFAITVFLSRFATRPVERAWKDQQRFIADASHELKTPVAGIRLLSESIERASKDGDVDIIPVFTERLNKESQRLQNLVTELLDLSRLENGGLGGRNKETCDLASVVSTSYETHVGKARLKGLEFVYDDGVGSDELCRVNLPPADASLLVDNLLDNAINYTDTGTVEVSLRCTDSKATLSVRDTGIGIPTADQERIFERFYRVDKGHSREMGGTGLGLAIVKHAALYHGGEVSVESEEDVGTRFTVRLPIG